MDNFSRSSRNVLNHRTADRFPGDNLFARIARAVCEAGCLPRKELFEAWEVAKRIRRKMRGGPVVEFAAGHGLLSAILLILDDSSPTAVCVDPRRPPSQTRVLAALESHWPRIKGRVSFNKARIVDATVPAGALLVSVHACGQLTDHVLDLAVQSQNRVAVLPCCHDSGRCDSGFWAGWMDTPLAIDTARAVRLSQAEFRVQTAQIPEEITPHNRLLLGWPVGGEIEGRS